MRIRRATAAAATALALGAVGVLTACGGDDESTTDSDESTSQTPTEDSTEDPAQEATDEPTGEPAEDSGDATADDGQPSSSGGAPVPVNETINDDVLGDSITITQVLRDFPPSADFSGITEDGGELVLVEVDVKAGDKFSGGVQGGFKLLAGGETAGTATTIAETDMTAAGYTPFDGVSSGETGGGWICFQVNTKANTYDLEYTRGAASVIGSDQTIDEKIWTIPLP